MPFTSEPASGSVTATAVIARPAMISGIQRAFCAGVPAFAMCTEAMSVCTSTVMATPREGRAAELLGEHDRAERVHLGAAVLGRVADAEEAELAHAAQHLARHEALLLPFRAVRLDLALDEAADLRAQRFVLLAEVGRGEGGRGVCSIRSLNPSSGGGLVLGRFAYLAVAAVTSISTSSSGRASPATTSVVTAGGALLFHRRILASFSAGRSVWRVT